MNLMFGMKAGSKVKPERCGKAARSWTILRKSAFEGSVIGRLGCGMTRYRAPAEFGSPKNTVFEAGSFGSLSPSPLLEIRPRNSNRNHDTSTFRPERSRAPKIGCVGVKLKPM